MIRENQKLLNQLNVISDGLILFLALPIAFWFRFFIMPDGIISVPLRSYMVLNVFLMLAHLLLYAGFGMYNLHRKVSLQKELVRLWFSGLLVMAVLLSVLFVSRGINYSRITLAVYFVLGSGGLSCKRIVLRLALRRLRREGYNQKHVVILGGGKMALNYLSAIQSQRELGYRASGYVSNQPSALLDGLKWLGTFDDLYPILQKTDPDEVISAIDMEDYSKTPQIIEACEKAGIKLSIIPFYAEYMPTNPQFDTIGTIPLLNIRRIPLDNWGNAFCKRAIDIICSLLLLIITSPIMLICTVGVRLSSPGPIIFRQERVGRNKKTFYMYKFRSMRVNDAQNTGWSTDHDSRKTKFGAFIRKYSLDEFPQFVNVLKGDMSLVGPRPELPHFVDQFKDEIPLYMVKHQVRPGITGWAQVNDFRGDTSIKARIEHDIYYIEHWNLLFDFKILLMTVFKGKFKNSEQLH